MKTLQSLFLGWTVSLTISPSGIALAQSVDLEPQKAVVVKLRIHRTNRSPDTAAGVYVGKDQQNAYFIIAYHAIKPKPEGVPVQSVELRFSTTPQNFEAVVFEYFDEGLDLGVVRTSVANLPQELPQLSTKDAAAGISIYIIGHPSAGDWSVWPGNVQNEYASSGDVQHFTTNRDASLAGGYSGGPVFDADRNFLGMHTETITSYGRAVRSEDIVTKLKVWRVPTNNFTNIDRDVAAIKKVLEAYADAYNRRDPNALWKIWPNPPASTKRAIEKSFSSASSIRMNLQPNNPEIAPGGASATATGQYSQEFMPKNGDLHRSNGAIAFGLEKRGTTWVITSIK